MTYQIRGFYGLIERDDFEKGCIGPAHHKSIPVNFEAGSIKELIDHACDFLGIPEGEDRLGYFELNACGEVGRVDFNIMENAEGYKPSMTEILQWKSGGIDLYYCNYSATIEKVVVVEAVY